MAEVISTIGAGKDYATLTLWEAAKRGNLIVRETIEIAEVYGEIDDRVVINGSTTNASYYMKITVPDSERHAGVWSNSKARIVPTTDGITIHILDNYVRVEWLQIKPLGTKLNTRGI